MGSIYSLSLSALIGGAGGVLYAYLFLGHKLHFFRSYNMLHLKKKSLFVSVGLPTILRMIFFSLAGIFLLLSRHSHPILIISFFCSFWLAILQSKATPYEGL